MPTSVVLAHRLSSRGAAEEPGSVVVAPGLKAPQHVESSWSRA